MAFDPAQHLRQTQVTVLHGFESAQPLVVRDIDRCVDAQHVLHAVGAVVQLAHDLPQFRVLTLQPRDPLFMPEHTGDGCRIPGCVAIGGGHCCTSRSRPSRCAGVAS